MQTSNIECIEAFTRLYGYIRFFHPSDEAAHLNWNDFCVYGLRKVKEADPAVLKETLKELFLPIAPTAKLFYFKDDAPAPAEELLPPDRADLDLVAWQHKGIEIECIVSMSASRRTNRIPALSPDSASCLYQWIPGKEHAGRRIKVQALTRGNTGEDSSISMRLYLVPRSGEAIIHDRVCPSMPLDSDDPDPGPWHLEEFVETLPENLVYLSLRPRLCGEGSAHFQQLRAFVENDEGEWVPLTMENADFAEGLAGWSFGNTFGYRFSTVEVEEGPENIRALRILSVSGPVFEKHAAPGEVRNLPIGAGLSVQLPLALFSRDGHTIGPAQTVDFDEFKERVDEVEYQRLSSTDEDLRLTDIVVIWTILQHFYPYFDLVDSDWDAVLTSALAAALTSSAEALDDRAHHELLKRMLAELHDGHARVNSHRFHDQTIGLAFEVVEEQVVVTATEIERVQMGDVLVAVDDAPAADALSSSEALCSGSPQRRRYKALNNICKGPPGTQVQLELQRGDKTLHISSTRDRHRPPQEARPEPIEKLDSGVHYVDLTRASMEEITEVIEELACAEAVIFDCRGYPNSTDEILHHLIDEPIQSAHWLMPLQIYPDQRDLVAYDKGGRWHVEPRKPRIRGRVFFLTDESAISYAESVMGIVEHYKLGEIVGRPTAGTNGNVNFVKLPSRGRVVFTGMRVVKHDHTQHHLIGILPTLPVERTIQGIREGRDEILERALERCFPPAS